MSKRIVKYMLFLTFLFCATGSLAQAQVLTPKPYGPPISVENAKKVAAVAIAEAKKNNWFMAVAIVDPSGTLVYYEKMDDTQTGSAVIAIEKARTSALFKRPSKVFEEWVAGGGSGLRTLGLTGAMPIGGGVPLVADGHIIGAIGVSGDTSDHDGQCALAGAAILK